MARPDAERVWLSFAQSALAGISAIPVRLEEGPSSWDIVNANLADDCAELADLMLERWRLRYGDEETKRPVAALVREPSPTAEAVNW